VNARLHRLVIGKLYNSLEAIQIERFTAADHIYADLQLNLAARAINIVAWRKLQSGQLMLPLPPVSLLERLMLFQSISELFGNGASFHLQAFNDVTALIKTKIQ